MKNIPARLTELRTLLRYHNQKYHIEDNPEISEKAVMEGMITMKEDGILKVMQGLTTL